jgi:hypothetical protein
MRWIGIIFRNGAKDLFALPQRLLGSDALCHLFLSLSRTRSFLQRSII